MKLLPLIKGDIKNITRDPILLISIFVPMIAATFFRFTLPIITIYFLELDIDIRQYYSFIISFLTMLAPMMIGTLVGFIILDERDEGLLTYFVVTPLSRKGYLMYRMINPIVLSFIFSTIVLNYVGLLELNTFELLPVIIMSALQGPMMALFLGTFANNKVEGIALSKALGLLYMIPAVLIFVGGRWELISYIFPPYWSIKAFIATVEMGQAFKYLVVGTGIHFLYLIYLYNRFNNKAF